MVALYVSVGRYVAGVLPQLKEEVVGLVSDRSELVVEVETIAGSWDAFAPAVVLEGVKFFSFDRTELLFEVGRVELGVDIWASMLDRTARFRLATISGTELKLRENARGSWAFDGFTGGDEAADLEPLLEAILTVQRLELSELTLVLQPLVEAEKRLLLGVDLERKDAFRRAVIGVSNRDTDTTVSVLIESQGDPRLPQTLSSRGWVDFKTRDAGLITPFLGPGSPLPDYGSLNGRIWLNWEQGQGSFVADLEGSDLAIDWPGARRESRPVEDIEFIISGEYGGGSSRLVLHEGSARWEEQHYDLPTLLAEADLEHLLVRVSHLELDSLSLALAQSELLSEELQGLFDQHRPVGRLDAMEFMVDIEGQKIADWRFRTELTEVGVTAVKAIPGVSGASGYLEVGRQSGRLDLDSKDIAFGFPLVYRDELSFDTLQTQLRWEVLEDRFELRSGPIIASGDEGPVQGLFGLVQPLGDDAGGPEMNLMIGLRDSDPSYRSKYLPYVLNDGLLEWLESSIGDGVVNAGAFLWRGALQKDQVAHRTVQLFFDIADTAFSYASDWPPLTGVDGLVVIDDGQVSVTTTRARIYDTPVTAAKVTVAPEPGRGLTVRVDAETHGRAADGLQLVNESMLRDIVGDVFSEWELRGALRTRLRLGLDLSGNDLPPEIEVDTTWRDIQIQAHDIDIALQGVNGEVSYSSVDGFSGDDLSGLLWDKPITVQIVQEDVENQTHGALNIEFAGVADVSRVQDWLDLDILAIAAGETAFTANLVVNEGETPLFTLQSELLGVGLEIPQPLGKATDEKIALHLSLPLGTESQRFTLQLADRLEMELELHDRTISGGHFVINPAGGEAAQIRANSLILTGHLDELVWSEWSGFVDQHILGGSLTESQGTPVETQGPRNYVELRVDSLSVDRLDVLGQSISEVLLSAWQESHDWRVKATTPFLDGIAGQTEDGYQLVIDRLDIGGLIDTLGEDIADDLNSDSLLPSLEISIADLQDEGRALGHLAFSVMDQGDRLELSRIQGELNRMNIGGPEGLALTWYNRNPEPITALRGEIGFGDIGDVLEQFNYERFLQTESGKISIDVSWPGSPFDAHGESLLGSVGFDSGPGAFLKTSNTASGTLKVLGILNLAALVQRADLGFDNLFTTGVSFDTGRGEVSFSRGVVMVDDIEVNGRASGFSFVGELDLTADEIEGQLVATLPIGSNLPWMAAVVGGLPAAAGVFVVSKLFETQMDRFSSLVYSVNGSLDQPELELSRVFDNKTRVVKEAEESPAGSHVQSLDIGGESP